MVTILSEEALVNLISNIKLYHHVITEDTISYMISNLICGDWDWTEKPARTPLPPRPRLHQGPHLLQPGRVDEAVLAAHVLLPPHSKFLGQVVVGLGGALNLLPLHLLRHTQELLRAVITALCLHGGGLMLWQGWGWCVGLIQPPRLSVFPVSMASRAFVTFLCLLSDVRANKSPPWSTLLYFTVKESTQRQNKNK